METVRCEELQLELSAARKAKTLRPSATSTSSGTATVTWAPTPTHHHQSPHQPTVTKQQPTSLSLTQPSQQSGTEIDRIMAKIEQARLSIANVCA